MRTRLFLAGLLMPAAVMAAVEITPLAGYRSGELDIDTGVVCVQSPCPTFAESEGSALYGAVLDVPLSDVYRFELLANRQASELAFRDSLQGSPNALETDLDVTHLHAGIMRLWRAQPVEPFVAVGVGRTWLDSPLGITGGIDMERWSGSLGGGVRYPFGDTDRFALRVEGRGYWVDLPENRRSGQVTLLDDRLTQIETSVGLTFSF